MPKITRQSDEQREAEFQRNLIRYEAKIGGELFGAIPAGHRRDFFCLDEHTWVWHEEWVEQGLRKATTTRYDVRPTVVLKSQFGQPYQPVGEAEARNLYQATQIYRQRISSDYQRMMQTV
ncbi:MAG: hypothetical protein ABIS48_02550 [Candidatus Saccharimonadales bacterium]